MRKGNKNIYEVYFDGGSRGNPGLGGSGAVIYLKQGITNKSK